MHVKKFDVLIFYFIWIYAFYYVLIILWIGEDLSIGYRILSSSLSTLFVFHLIHLLKK